MKQIAEAQQAKDQDQLSLWGWVGDRRITRHAAIRYYVGDFFEEATRVALNAQRLKTTSGRVCPDLKLASGAYVECKSIGKSSDCIVFDHRMESYEKMIAEGKRLFYIFWRHTASLKGVAFVSEVNERLALAVSDAVIVSAQEIHALMRKSRVYIGKYFYHQQRPCEFRRLRSKSFTDWFTRPLLSEFSGQVYNARVASVPILSSLPAEHLQ